MARARSISSQCVTALRDGWTAFITDPGAISAPEDVEYLPVLPIPAVAPGTIAAAVAAIHSPILDAQSPDAVDVWYQRHFDAPDAGPGTRETLVFDGLATLATVYLNGETILQSDNMFLRHEVDVTGRLRQGQNELIIHFAALNPNLEKRRPRPHWRTHLIDHQQLRWIRTTVVGRMPGIHQRAQYIHAVGPWRPITLVQDRVMQLTSARLHPSVNAEGTGLIEAHLLVRPLIAIGSTTATLHVGDHKQELSVNPRDDGSISLSGVLRVANVDLWWPHTHGGQPLYAVQVEVRFDGCVADGLQRTSQRAITLGFPPTGFRTTTLNNAAGNFGLASNGAAVFARGAVWTAADPLNLAAARGKYEHPLTLARDAGMNMLRVAGTGFYETDDFYDRCAELGIALWQEFAFAMLDYPDDADFLASAEAEARQLLDRLELNPALSILCGNCEGAATAAMHGFSAEQWRSRLFDEILPAVSREVVPFVPYLPTSAWGGALPFHADSGTVSYYGVGAYRHPLEDARRAGVRFASECLAFSNIPDDETIDSFLAPGEWPGHHPSWKAGVPRNVSLGFDFDDVRDHYARSLFGEDTASLLFSDSERYLALGRATSAEIMETTFHEWRRAAAPCAGAIVLDFRDLWPGAGLGILDGFGRPKSVYFALKRALAPLAIFFSDEGMNGLRVHVVNDRPHPIDATLRVALYRHGLTRIESQSLSIQVGPNAASDWSVDALIGRFADTTYAYRFGPAVQDVTTAALESTNGGAPLAPTAFYFPIGRRFARSADLGLSATAHARSSGSGYTLNVRVKRFAQTVSIDARGFLPDDNYFHMEPGQERHIDIEPFGIPPKRLAWSISALNSPVRVKINFKDALSPA